MKRILVVDDDLDILNVVKYLLEGEGYSVSLCSSGDQTFRYVKEFQPDLVILDIRIGHIDGRDVFRMLRENPGTCSIPVVMFSANYSLMSEINVEPTPDAFIAKPFDIDIAVKIIGSLIK